jgi:hypothetical protein
LRFQTRLLLLVWDWVGADGAKGEGGLESGESTFLDLKISDLRGCSLVFHRGWKGCRMVGFAVGGDSADLEGRALDRALVW